jgi:hypothetical protein
MAAAAPIPQVQLPFPSYKWRWMEAVPVESFNRLDILLGVTRAIQACEGLAATSDEFETEMQALQNDFFPEQLQNQPFFPQTADGRTVLRRQGGYWRGLGLLTGGGDELQLTQVGQDFADGRMTIDDFVQWTVRQEELPGAVIRSPASRQPWLATNTTVRPLSVIVGVLLELARDNAAEAYLTTMELAEVLVPLQLVLPDASDLAAAVLRFRENPIPFAQLPDCASGANDHRMLREHLLFLHNAGLLSMERVGPNRFHHRFGLTQTDAALAVKMADLQAEDEQAPPEPPVNTIEIVQRARKIVEVLNRPGQAKFRSEILANCNGRCVLSGEQLPEVLVACHIHEVKDGGPDLVSNGIMLRADLHALFDCNKIRISHKGQIVLSPDVSACATYAALPDQIDLPQNLNAEALRRRFLYGAVLADGDN